MPPRIRFFFSAMMVPLFFIPALALYRETFQHRDIWWTPQEMLVPLAESKDRVELYARGKPLAALLQAEQLRIAAEGEWSVLATSDVGLRFNNWDRVRADQLPLLLGDAAMCGAIALMFLLIVTGRLAYRGDKGSVAA